MNSENQTKENDTLILHFAADGRLPIDTYSSYIVRDSFKRAIYGTLTSMTQNGLVSTEDEDSILDYIDSYNGDPTKLIFRIKQGLFFSQSEQKPS